ncbi:MAG: hypothetical protein FWD97_02300 [Defluviitaleaceae bacterium]|nr:hypothetical protein [Defluviitaleaceae bacterium]
MSQFPDQQNQTTPPPFGAGPPPGDDKATLALVFGILALVLSPLWGIASFIFRKQALDAGYTGNKAQIGFICSLISVGLWGLGIVACVACIGCASLAAW